MKRLKELQEEYMEVLAKAKDEEDEQKRDELCRDAKRISDAFLEHQKLNNKERIMKSVKPMSEATEPKTVEELKDEFIDALAKSNEAKGKERDALLVQMRRAKERYELRMKQDDLVSRITNRIDASKEPDDES